MSILQRALGSVYRPTQGTGIGFYAGSTYTGRSVSVQSALGLVPVYAAVSQIAGAVGSLPLVVYERAGEYRERATEHRAWRLLHDEPNPEMAADEVWEIVASHIELWGNAFLYKKRDSLGIVRELWPISPSRVGVTRDDEERRIFFVDGETFDERTILHIRGLSSDGLVGYSPIQLQRDALSIQQAQEEFQGKFLKSDGKPAVLLRHPNKLQGDAKERLKASWDAVKSGGTAVLEEDIHVEKWTMPLEDAQFIEQMQFSDLRVAQMFLLPPGRLGAKTGDSLTYSTVEAEGLQFVTNTLQRRITRIEGAVNRDSSIFADPTRRHFAEFLVDALLRANLKDRYEAYMVGIKAGFLTQEDVRPKENLPELPEQPPPVANPPEGDELDAA